MGAKASLLIFLMLAMAIPLSSALSLDNPNFLINKTVGTNSQIEFTLINDDSTPYYNITFEDNDVIEMDEIDKLAGNSQINVTANVVHDDNFNDEIRIEGLREASLGQSNETTEVSVDFNNGLSKCDMSLVEGDQVTWFSEVSDPIKLINADNGNTVTTIEENSNYTQSFNFPTDFNYYFTRLGFQFAPGSGSCKITVLDDSGLVHDPETDAILNLQVNVEFQPTTISTNLNKNSYSMRFFETQEDQSIVIENTGDNTAKGVKLSGEWFSGFSAQNFDLNPGQSRTVLFDISPEITTTNETNETYDKILNVEGNFPTEEHEVSIFIEHDIISNGSGESRSFLEILQDQLEAHCETPENRNQEICVQARGGVSVNGSNNQRTATFNITEEQKNQLFLNYFEMREILETSLNDFQQSQADIKNNISSLNNRDEQQAQKLNSIEAQTRNVTGSASVLLTVLSLAIIIGSLGFVSWKLYKRNKFKEDSAW